VSDDYGRDYGGGLAGRGAENVTNRDAYAAGQGARLAGDASQERIDGKKGSGPYQGIQQREGIGPAVLIPAFFAIVVLFVFLAAFFPLSGALTIAAGYLASTALNYFFPRAWGLQQVVVVLPAMFVAWQVASRIEKRLEKTKVFRIVRHLVRLMAMAVVAIGVIELFHNGDIMRRPGDLTAVELGGVGAFVVLMHFLGWWYEKSFDAAQNGVPYRIVPAWLTPARARLLTICAVPGGLAGAFLGYSAFDTGSATLLGLGIGGVAGIVLMLALWVVTWPVRGVFARFPVLWPVLVGVTVGIAIAWRLSQVESMPFADYAASSIGGSVVALVVPYLAYRLLRAMFRPRQSSPGWANKPE
jgi:hypothetical protein